MICGKNHLEWQEITILLNGERVDRYRFESPGEIKDIRLTLAPRTGHNVLTIEYQAQDETDPKRPLSLLFRRLQIMKPDMFGPADKPGV
jgi:hypothetical protein